MVETVRIISSASRTAHILSNKTAIGEDETIYGINLRLTDALISGAIDRAVASGSNRLVVRGVFYMPLASNGFFFDGLTEPFNLHFDGAILLQDGDDSSEYSNFIRAENCTGHLSITGDVICDYEKLPWFQGTCSATAATSADFTLEDGYSAPTFSTAELAVDWADGNRAGDYVFSNVLSPATFALVSGTTYRLSGSTVDGTAFTIGNRHTIVHDKFAKHAIHLVSNMGGISIGAGFRCYAASGMGLYCNGGGPFRFDGHFLRKPGTTRLISLTADGIHIDEMRGAFAMHGATVEGLCDDCVNLGNHVIDIDTVDFGAAPRQFRGDMLTGAVNNINVGDQLAVMNGAGEYQATVEVATVSGSGISDFTVTTVQDLPSDITTAWFVANLSCLPTRPVIRDCHFGFSPNKGVVVQAPEAIISGCSFEHIWYSAILGVPYVQSSFREAYNADKITVIGNTCYECAVNGVNDSTFAVINVRADDYDGLANPDAAMLDGIVIKDNVIRGSNKGAIRVSNGISPRIVGNVMFDVCRVPFSGSSTDPSKFPIDISYSTSPIVAGNVNDDPNQSIGQVNSNPGQVFIVGNSGLRNGGEHLTIGRQLALMAAVA